MFTRNTSASQAVSKVKCWRLLLPKLLMNEECWRLFEDRRPRARHFPATYREPFSMPPSATAHHRIGPARASSLESQLLDFERSCSPWLKLTRRRADWRRNASRPLTNFETNMDLPNRKPDILTSIPAGRGPWLRVTANMLEGIMASGADMYQDKFIAFVDIFGFSDLVRQSEQKKEGGPSLEDLLALTKKLGSPQESARYAKSGPVVCPHASYVSKDLDFQITQISDCVIVSSEVSPAGIINLV